MRFLPNHTEGLHEALPSPPPPLIANPISNSPALGGLVGCMFFLASLATRRKPHLALTAASTTTVALASYNGFNQFRRHGAHEEFLKSHDIQIPKRQLVERVLELDNENVIFAAGLAGVMLGLGRVRPGGWLSRWCRTVEHKPLPSKNPTIGSFSLGACVGATGLTVFPLPGTAEAASELLLNEQKAAPWRDELQTYEWKWYSSFGLSRQSAEVDHLEQPKEDASHLEHMYNFTHLFKQTLPVMFASDEDEFDPRPHHSDLVLWKRRFMPSRNHEYQAKSTQDLQDHLEQLQVARTELLPQAELIWHKLAQAEAANLTLLGPGSQTDEVAVIEAKAELRMLGDAHNHIWSRIGDIDWMIADTNKQILQHQAREGGRHWEPSLSAKAKSGKPDEAFWYIGMRLMTDLLVLDELKIGRKLLVEALAHGTIQKQLPDAPEHLKRIDTEIEQLDLITQACRKVLRDLFDEEDVGRAEDLFMAYMKNMADAINDRGKRKEEYKVVES